MKFLLYIKMGIMHMLTTLIISIPFPQYKAFLKASRDVLEQMPGSA
jgi:hypothetical protein